MTAYYVQALFNIRLMAKQVRETPPNSMAPLEDERESYAADSANAESISSDLLVQDLVPEDDNSYSEKASKKYNVYGTARSHPNNTEEQVEPKKSIWRQVLAFLRPSCILDHLDIVSVKVALQTWIQCWPTVFFLVIPVVVHWFGAAAFLMQIIGFLAAAGGRPLIQNIYDTLMSSFFTLLGWLFIVLCQLITNRIRGSITMKELGELLIRDGSCTPENLEVCLSEQIYTGRFLETRCTMIYVIAFVIYYAVSGVFMSRNLRLYKTPFICGCILTIILLCYNNFWPTFNPKDTTIIIVKPMMFSFAYKLVCAFVVFPDAASYHYFNGSVGLFRAMNQMMTLNLNFFMTMKPSNDYFSEFKYYHRDVVRIREDAAKLELMAAFTKYEVSYGRLSSGFVGEIRSMSKHLLSMSAGYEYFYQAVEERKNFAVGNILSLNKNRTRTSTFEHDSNLKIFGAISEAYKPVGNYENNLRISLIKQRLEQMPNAITLHQLDTLCDLLKEFYYPYMKVNVDAVGCIADWLDAANHYRLFSLLPGKRKSHVQKQKEMMQKIIDYKEKITFNINELQSYERFTYFRDKTSNEELTMTLISLTSLVTFFTVQQTKAVLSILNTLLYLDEQRPTPRFYTYFTKTFHENARNVFAAFNTEEHDESIPTFKRNESISKRNPDALPPSSISQIIGRKFVKVYFTLLDEQFLFWIRASFLVICCAIPYFCRTTAHWYYINRCIWVPIVCAFSTTEYSGETVYIFFSKLIYGFFGCVIGCVGWYISTGKGHGNPYGFAVVTAFMFLFLSFHRHFAKHSTMIPQILMSLTAALVLGTSWTDRFAQGANAGFGIEVAYKRFVMVVVGLSVALLSSTVPRPRSSKVAFRRIISRVIGEAGNLHCDVASFALQRISAPGIHISERHDPIVTRFRLLLMKLAGTAGLMVPINNEIPIIGDWPSQKYEGLIFAVNDFVQLYSIIHQVFDLIEDPSQYIPKLIRSSGWDNAEMNASLFSVLHMTSDALATSDSLPKVTTGTISLKHLEYVKQQWGVQRTHPSEAFISNELHKKVTNTELHESLNKNLDHEKLFTKDGNLNIVGVILCHFIYKRIDEILILVKSLVGEKYDLNEGLLDGLEKFKGE